MAQLRRTVVGSSAAVLGTGLVLGLVFGVLVAPDVAGGGSCRTGLYPGTYADLVTPLHVLAFAVVCGAVFALARARGQARRTAIALAVGAAYVAAALAYPPLFGAYGLIALVLLVPATAVLAVVVAVMAVDARRQPTPKLRWEVLGRAATVGLWVALAVLLSGAYAAAWTNGAGVLCF